MLLPPSLHTLTGSKITAEQLVSGINTLYARTLPTRPPVELRGLPEEALQPGQRPTASPGLADIAGVAGANMVSAAGGGASSCEALAVKERLKRALREVRQSQQLAAQQQSPSSAHVYWTAEKAMLWGGILAAG